MPVPVPESASASTSTSRAHSLLSPSSFPHRWPRLRDVPSSFPPCCRGAFPIRAIGAPAQPALVFPSRADGPVCPPLCFQGEEGPRPPGASVGQVVSHVFFLPGLALCPEVQDLLEGGELPDLPSSLLLPEDTALRNLPPLRAAHRRFNFDTDRPLLSALEEVRMGFLMPQLPLLVSPGSTAGSPTVQAGRVSLGWAGPGGLPPESHAARFPSWQDARLQASCCRTGLAPLHPPFIGGGTGTVRAGRDGAAHLGQLPFLYTHTYTFT